MHDASGSLASYTVPTNTCTFNNLTVSTNQTLTPGTYCGGILINGNSQVTFSPGLYYIQNGDFQILGSSNVTANNATFLISGSSSNININTTGTVTMSPNTSGSAGQWAGFQFYYDPPSSSNNKNSAKAGQNTISSAQMTISGVVYLAGQKLNIKQGASLTVNPGVIVADFILPDGGSLSLTGDLNSANPANLKKAVESTVPILIQ